MDLPRRCPHSSALHGSGGLLPVAMATEFHSSKVNDFKKKNTVVQDHILAPANSLVDCQGKLLI